MTKAEKLIEYVEQMLEYYDSELPAAEEMMVTVYRSELNLMKEVALELMEMKKAAAEYREAVKANVGIEFADDTESIKAKLEETTMRLDKMIADEYVE